jgi:hypothetical protein
MPRIANVRERRHQPFWDSLIRTTGDPVAPLQNSTNLFGNSNVGNLALTNLQVAGQLASDQTYVILALRAWLYFNGTGRRANYLRVNAQLYWTLIVGEKPMFQAPCWYFPAGGGTWGFDANVGNGGSIFNNGEPSQEAILKLARPVVVPVRQNFAVQASFFPMGSVSALDGLNSGATDDEKEIKFVLDGSNVSEAA